MFEWFLIVIPILLSSLFSGTEIAYVTANRLKLEVYIRQNVRASASVQYFLKNPEVFLSTILLATNIVNVLAVTFMTIFMADTLTTLFMSVFGTAPSGAQLLAIQTVLAATILLIFGEILPKILFRINPESAFTYMAGPLRVVSIALKPLIWGANKASALVVRLFRIQGNGVEHVFRRQDIEHLFTEIGEDGGNTDIDKEETEILTNVLKLSGMRVKESMITRTEIQAVDMDTSIPEVLKMFMTSGFSKLPVYDETIDNVIGMVYAYDMFSHPASLKEVIRPIKLVTESRKSRDLLAEFRRSHNSMAVVIDEYGGTAGLITIEDLLEEVVGDIQDEYDTDDVIIKMIGDATWMISGNAYLEDIEERFPELKTDYEDEDYETLAGHITYNLGRIPKVNEEIRIGELKFVITKATPTRIETVKVIKVSD